MKNLSLLMIVVVMSLVVKAQNFESLMLKNVQKIEQKSKKVELLKLSAEFKNMAKEYPKRYEAEYYQALSLVFYAFDEKDVTKKEHQLLGAEKIINKICKEKPQEAELFILKALCYQAMIMVDPIKRGYSYSQKADVELEKAKLLDEKNPRYFFLKGQNLFYTPEQYGGGKAKAKPYFEKADKLFRNSKKSHQLSPSWGEQTNRKQLKASQK